MTDVYRKLHDFKMTLDDARVFRDILFTAELLKII